MQIFDEKKYRLCLCIRIFLLKSLWLANNFTYFCPFYTKCPVLYTMYIIPTKLHAKISA